MRKMLLGGAMALAVFGASPLAGNTEFGTIGLDESGMDRTVRPGDDFWAYMNGGWLKAVEIPADRSYWGDVARLREQSLARVRDILIAAASSPSTVDARKFGNLYASYMDEATAETKGAAPLAPDLRRIAAIQTPRDLARAMATLERVQPPFSYGSAQSSFPVHADVDIDLKNPRIYAASLSQGGLGLPDRNYYLGDDPKFAVARQAYRTYIVKLFELAGIADREARADRIVALETELAKIQWTRIDSRDLEKTFNPMSPEQLAAIAPGFDWRTYLEAAGFARESQLIVAQASAITGFAKLAGATPLETWRDYMSARIISNAAPLLSKGFVDANFAFFGQALAGTPQLTDRWKRAVAQVNNSMGDAVGREYAARYFPPAAKAKIEAMVVELKAAMARRIDGLDWMAPQTKVRAKTKLANLKIEVGYPDHWRNYSRLTIAKGNLYGDVQNANAFEYDRNLAKLGQLVDRSEWAIFATPQTVNAFNAGALVKLVFPAARMAPPFFDPDADPAVNYGAIGSVIGHEISHSFDDQGAKLDEKGHLINWWTQADVNAFKAATGRLATQYDAYEALPGVHLQGSLELGENVGDLGGLAAALDAYHASLGGKPAPVIDGLTGDQRFFLGNAQCKRWLYRDPMLRQVIATDPHAPDKYRAFTVRNLDAWYDAFDVKPGDKLYLTPAQRVHIW